MFARIRLFVLMLVAAAVVPTISQAQTAKAAEPTPLAGPRRELTATALQQWSQATTNEAFDVTQRRRQSMGQPVALMLVGGAAILLGALIGDDVGIVFIVGGAVAFLIGLYNYTK